MKGDVSAKGASVRARLANLAREKAVNLELYLVRYAHERLLFRLGAIEASATLHSEGPSCCRRFGSPIRSGPHAILTFWAMAATMRQLSRPYCRTSSPLASGDGIDFDTKNLSVEPIREENAYGGLRLETTAHLAGARIKIQVNIGFGDAVTPDAMEIDYPVLLDLPNPRVRAYPKETAVAEKLQAIVVLGMTNGRMKDFYDLWMMSRYFEFDGATLAKAIAATFSRRRTPLPTDTPAGLSEEFSKDADAIKRWGFFRLGIS